MPYFSFYGQNINAISVNNLLDHHSVSGPFHFQVNIAVMRSSRLALALKSGYHILLKCANIQSHIQSSN